MKTRTKVGMGIAGLAVAAVTGVVMLRDESPQPRPLAVVSGPSEPECIFDPPKSTNAINAPCFTVLTAVAKDDKGATGIHPVVIHFTPKPSPTPPCKIVSTVNGPRCVPL